MRAVLCLASWICVVGVFGACNNDLERQSQLERVRVLGIRANPAEVALDPDGLISPAPVQLTALTFAPDGGTPTITYALCRLSANVYSQDIQCPGADGLALDGGVFDVTDPSVRSYLAEGDAGVPLSEPASQPQLARGIRVNIGYFASNGTPGDRGMERGVYQLSIRATRTPNQNPHIAEVFVDGGTPVQSQRFPLNTKVTFTPSLSPDSIETYVDVDGQTQTEQLVYSWFATGAGRVEDFRSQEPFRGVGKRESDYTTAKVPEDVTLYVVVRDGRGGTDWIIRTFSVSSGVQ